MPNLGLLLDRSENDRLKKVVENQDSIIKELQSRNAELFDETGKYVRALAEITRWSSRLRRKEFWELSDIIHAHIDKP